MSKVVYRGIPSLIAGFKLEKKENKTRQEEEAAASFQHMVTSVLLTAILGLFTVFLILYLFSSFVGEHAILGARHGDLIEYEYDGDTISIPYEDSMDVADNTKAAVYLNGEGEVEEVVSYQVYSSRSFKYEILMIVVVMAAAALIVYRIWRIQNKQGKQWYTYIRNRR